VIFTLVMASVKILREYERAVVFTLDRFQRVKGPGLVLLMPFIQEMVRPFLELLEKAGKAPVPNGALHDRLAPDVPLNA
jgi:regulator of protease activity HflC (stomatin/prohibitin superfamily)